MWCQWRCAWEVQLLDAGHCDGKAASKESNKVPMKDEWDEEGILCRLMTEKVTRPRISSHGSEKKKRLASLDSEVVLLVLCVSSVCYLPTD